MNKYFEHFHILNNGEMKTEADNYFDEKVADKDWNSLLKEKFKDSVKKVEENAADQEKIWSSWNITKEVCNFKAPATVNYVVAAVFIVRFI